MFPLSFPLLQSPHHHRPYHVATLQTWDQPLLGTGQTLRNTQVVVLRGSPNLSSPRLLTRALLRIQNRLLNLFKGGPSLTATSLWKGRMKC